MVSDSITNAPIPSAPNSRDFSKKKRANRSAKLKQCKLDARREQWLSQGAVKSKGCKEEGNCARKERNRSLENPRRRDEDNNNNNNGSIHHESDSESPSNSPTNSLLGGGSGSDSGTNFIGSSSSSSSSISSSSSGGCCSGSISEEEEEDGCLDDWEAVADALAADDDNNKSEPEHENSYSQSPSESQLSMQSDSMPELTDGIGLDSVNSMTESAGMVPRMSGNNTRAWRPDDAYRPQSLPNLAKQRSFPVTNRHFGHGGVPWACNNVLTAPSSCPICYEDLDLTDSSFLPCLCGFRLCLFCHKRILEEDGRCPGCRKPYEHDQVESEASVQGSSLTFRLARSCSMVARS
ncbi:hypothetical protein JRO89_XS13G0185700 [Xanthoceras sorbifolium]|uniref:RING-type domain-containing protein n=1 Tax=Xanthoceras sorbifolium TaxID=99658 RepID=A0ABQ8H909_9ROSI|nr:hypothetical protein JRO89_XS13G0185700 [Xanthoceras sorbifolium]